MKTAEAIEFFGTQQAVAEACGIKQSSVAEWGDYPPPLRQLQLQTASQGKLLAEDSVMALVGNAQGAVA